MKGSAYGYIIGVIIGVPLFAFAVNYFFFKGNRATDIEINQYLKQSKVETFAVSKWIVEGHDVYIVSLQRGNNSAAIHWFTFYDNNYKKYFNLYMFSYLEPQQQGSERVGILGFKNSTFTATVNQEQLNNPYYGTKEHPVPIWPKDLIEYDGKKNDFEKDSYISNEINTFYVKPETQRLFIGQYLSRFMPKEEYKKMFKK